MQKKFGIAVIKALPSKPQVAASAVSTPLQTKLSRSLSQLSFASGAGGRWSRAPRRAVA